MVKNKAKARKILIVVIVSILVMCLLSATFAVYFETKRIDTIDSSPRGAYIGEPKAFADNSTTLENGHAFNFYLTNAKDGVFFNKVDGNISFEFNIQLNPVFIGLIYGSDYSIDFKKIDILSGQELGSLKMTGGGVNNFLYIDKLFFWGNFADVYSYRIVFTVKKSIDIGPGEEMFKVDFDAFDGAIEFLEKNKASIVYDNDNDYNGIQINLEPVGLQVPADFVKVEEKFKVKGIDDRQGVFLIAFKNGRQDKSIGLRLVSDTPGKEDSHGKKLLIRTMQLYYVDNSEKPVMLDSSYTLSIYFPISWGGSTTIKYWY